MTTFLTEFYPVLIIIYGWFFEHVCKIWFKGSASLWLKGFANNLEDNFEIWLKGFADLVV